MPSGYLDLLNVCESSLLPVRLELPALCLHTKCRHTSVGSWRPQGRGTVKQHRGEAWRVCRGGSWAQAPVSLVEVSSPNRPASRAPEQRERSPPPAGTRGPQSSASFFSFSRRKTAETSPRVDKVSDRCLAECRRTPVGFRIISCHSMLYH